MQGTAHRHAALDVLRGTAVAWMTVFHFCFDLNFHGYLHQDFLGDPLWTLQRSAIVGMFVLCAGLGQALALQQALGWPRFWRRWAQVAVGALLVTAGSWWMFPRSYIYFGVLHAMAAMLLVARLTHGAGRWLWPLGAVAFVLPWLLPPLWAGTGAEAFFDSRPGSVLGLVVQKPFTEDYVPIFPWLGVLWWGMAMGRSLQWHGVSESSSAPERHRFTMALAWLGRNSLSWYMLHQPVLLGLLAAVAWLR